MTPEVQQKLVEFLEAVGRSIGTETARLWPQIVGMTYVTSLFWAITLPTLTLASVVVTLVAFRRVRQWEYPDGTNSVAVCVVLVALLLVTASLIEVPGHIAGVFYPEAMTLRQLAEGFKAAK